MAIQVRCPTCRTRNAVSNRVCSKCTESIGKMANKDYWIDYYFEGKRNWEHIGRSKKAAENRFREVKTQITEGRYINSNRDLGKTLEGVADWYFGLQKVRALRSFSTLRKRIENVCRVIGGGKHITGLHNRDIELFFKARGGESSKWKKNDSIAPATINKEFSALKAMLNKAVQLGELESNPIEKIPNIRVDNVRTRIINNDELHRMLEVAPHHLRGVLLMAFYEPLRKKQITQLTWDEIDLKDNLIRLGAEKTKGGKSGQIIPIHPEVKQMLKHLPRSLQSNRVFLYYDKQGVLRPFDDFKGAWDTIRKKTGLEEIVFHDFRHTAITNLRKAGNSTTVIMKASGHKTMSMFLRYNLVDEEDVKGIRWREEEADENSSQGQQT